MARSIKLNDENYIDSTGIVHNKQLLNEILTPVILYQNETGTYENFTLNDSVSNYKYIDIMTLQSGYTQGYKVSRLYDPNGKKVMINYISYDGSLSMDRLQSFGISVTFNNKSCTTGNQFGYVVGTNNYVTVTNSIKITKVIGYK